MSTHVLPDRCWELSHHPETYGAMGEGWPHFRDRAKALESLWQEYSEARGELGEGELRDERPELLGAHPQQLEQACVVLICDGCGLGMHWEGNATPAGTHFDTVEDALEWAVLDSAWATSAAGGRVFHHCVICNGAAEVVAS